MEYETAAQHNFKLTGHIEPPPVPVIIQKQVLDESATRMLRSIQDTLGFSAAEDAILKWLEGCTVDGVERLSFAIDDYLANRIEAEAQNESGNV